MAKPYQLMTPAERLADRINKNREKSRTGTLASREEEDWERYEYLEHFVRLVKAAAYLKLSSSRTC